MDRKSFLKSIMAFGLAPIAFLAGRHIPVKGFWKSIDKGIISTFRVEISDRPNHGFVRALITDVSKEPYQHCAIQQPYEQGNVTQKRWALDTLSRLSTDIIRRRVFPKDSLVYDAIPTESGIRYCNPRYPS